MLKFFNIIFLFIQIRTNSFLQSREPTLESLIKMKNINLSYYNYPSPNDEKYYYIPIISTNDIHGTYYSTIIKNNNLEYENGGLDYLGKYISIIRKEFGNNRVLYFDGGDQFQGGLESKLSNGTIITEFFNIMGLNASTFGNHEFDYGKNYLFNILKLSNFNYLSCNILNKTTNSRKILENVIPYKIFNFLNDKIKIGVIGLSNKLKEETSTGKFNELIFEDYAERLIETSKEIKKNNNLNALLLLCHVDLKCPQNEKRMTLNIWDKDNSNSDDCNKNTEIYKLIYKISKGTIDAIISAHSHYQTHEWINDIPIISNINFGKYISIMYLPFDLNDNYKLVNNEIKIESPIPVCQKIFLKSKKCEIIKEKDQLFNFTFHNYFMEPYEKLSSLHNKYFHQLNNFRNKIVSYLLYDKPLSSTLNPNNPLGNIFVDFMKDLTKSDISILNSGGLRTTLIPGNITQNDIYNMFPFDNQIVTFKLNGYDLKKLIKNIQIGNYSFYPISGIKITVSLNPNKRILNVYLSNGDEIDDNKLYKITSVDYLINGGDDFRNVLSWFKPIDIEKVGIVSDEFIKFYEDKPVINVYDHFDEKKPRIEIVNSNFLS